MHSNRDPMLPVLIGGVLLFSATMAGTAFAAIPTDESLATLPPSTRRSIVVKDYFPRPAPGVIRINELSRNGQLVQIERYRNAGGGLYYLEDYYVTPDRKLVWLDTWTYTVDASGYVMEIMDSLVDYDNPASWANACKSLADRCTFTDQRNDPLNHGNVLSVPANLATGWFYSQASGTATPLTIPATSQPSSTFYNNYAIRLTDVKSRVVLPGGTFFNVSMQDEQQTDGVKATNYRFYFAPGVGIIAQQFYNERWEKTVALLYLSKTCTVTSNLYFCP
ncbi:MAG: hypothetical protein E6Q88_12465 [Lysobacteraceae bacterium]|nr:MAG: hypothetical protein E6Q88_12465 [Xanthomonadaceae bacterium]